MSTADDEPRALPTVPAGSPADVTLRESLSTLRDHLTEPATRRVLNDVLAGRASARTLVTMPEFAQLLDRGVREYQAQHDADPQPGIPTSDEDVDTFTSPPTDHA